MTGGRESPRVQWWLDEMGLAVAGLEPRDAREGTAFGQWFDRDTDRREGRRTGLFLVGHLDRPYQIIPPDEMRRTLALMETTRLPSTAPFLPRCDVQGVPTT